MTPSKTRLDRQTLADVVRTIFRGELDVDPMPVNHPLPTFLRRSGVFLLGGAWVVLVVLAPLLLALAFLGLNYTPEWLLGLAWLTGLTCTWAGMYIVTKGGVRVLRGDRRGWATVCAGFGLLAFTSAVAVVLRYGLNDEVNPFITLGALGVVATVLLIWGIVHVATESHKPLLARLAFFVGMACFGTGLIVSYVVVRPDVFAFTPTTYHVLHTLSRIYAPTGWVLLLLARIGQRNRPL